MKKELFNSVGGIMKVEDDKYYILNDKYGYECYVECTRERFIEELKSMSWVCLTSWDKNYRNQYLDLVDYVKENEKDVR